MKKYILVFCIVLTAIGLTAFGYVNRVDHTNYEDENLELVYNVDSRFASTITKEKLNNAKTIHDILPRCGTQARENFQNSRVSILDDNNEITEVGESEILNKDQTHLLHSVDYSDNIRVTSICSRKDIDTGQVYPDSIVYYMTVIPKKEAKYKAGQEALLTYLKESTKDHTSIIKMDQLKPGRVNFTVTKSGTISNVILDSTSGYDTVDKKLIEAISSMSEDWYPATNSKGENVDQELVFFFGLQGC